MLDNLQRRYLLRQSYLFLTARTYLLLFCVAINTYAQHRRARPTPTPTPAPAPSPAPTPIGTSVTLPAGANLDSFIASHRGYAITVPAGNYILNNANGASGLTINSWAGEIDFATGAKLLCNTFNTSAGWCVNIQGSDGVVLRGLWVGYTAPLTLSRDQATTGAIQVWNSANISVYTPHVDTSTGIGFVLGLSKAVSVHNAEVFNSTADGLSFVNDQDSILDGLTAQNTGDDGLSVINYGFYTNYTGFTGKNIVSIGSKARGISVPGQSSVTISNFTVQNAVKSGIITQQDFSWDTRRPVNVSWSNGQISNSGLFGIQTDAADNVTYNNIQVTNSGYGGWYGCDSPCSSVTTSGVSLTSSGDGSALFVGSLTSSTFTDVAIADSSTYGAYITKSSGLMFSNTKITNVAKDDSLHRAWWAESNTGTITVNGLLIADDQAKATGYIIGEWQNPASSIKVTGLQSQIANGKLQVQSSSSGVTFQTAQ